MSSTPTARLWAAGRERPTRSSHRGAYNRDWPITSMTSERWRRVEELYHAALARGIRDRVAFLADACAGDEALQARAARLTLTAVLAPRWTSELGTILTVLMCRPAH